MEGNAEKERHEDDKKETQVNEETITDKKEDDIENKETPVREDRSNSNIEIQTKEEQVNEDKLNDKFLNEQTHSKEEEIIPQTISNEEDIVKEEEDDENEKRQNENAFRINEQISNEGEITLLKKEQNNNHDKQQLSFQCENSTFSIQSEKTKVGTQQQQQPQIQHHIEHTTQDNKPIQHQMPQMMCAPFIMQPGMQGMPEQKQDRAQIVYVPIPYFIGYQDVDGKKPNMPNMYPMYYPMQQPYQQNQEQMQAQYYCVQPPGFYPMMVNPMGQMEQYGNKQTK